ncbi:MAG: hypothetical protein Kow00120_09430 [Anaerolineae bacterium]
MSAHPPRRTSVTERLRKARGAEPAAPDAEAVTPEDEAGWEPDARAGVDEEGEGIRLTDPFFSYLVAVALSLGLLPVETQTRYAILWTALLVLGAGFYLLSPRDRTADSEPANLVWGGAFGLLIGVPVLALIAPALAATSHQLFPEMSDASAYLALVFAIPVGETLFFRGALQETRGFRFAAVAASVWSVLLFIPNRTLAEAIAIAVTLVGLSFAYAYVRQRNGLAAAWVCQVVVNACLLFVPRLL